MAHDAADGHQQRRAGIPRSSPTDPVISALVELAAGRPVIVADDPDRENEIDFVAAADDLTRPGHVAPLVARPGGVLERGGHTEAGVDLTRLAGLQPAAAIVELQHDDGTMVRLHEWPAFRLRHRLPDLAVLTISDLIAYRRRTEVLVRHVGVAELPTSQGRFRVHAYREAVTGAEHLALVMGEIGDGALVRVHSECRTGDALGSLRCDCRAQLEMALSV